MTPLMLLWKKKPTTHVTLVISGQPGLVYSHQAQNGKCIPRTREVWGRKLYTYYVVLQPRRLPPPRYKVKLKDGLVPRNQCVSLLYRYRDSTLPLASYRFYYVRQRYITQRIDHR
jgi:hypothetical protein